MAYFPCDSFQKLEASQEPKQQSKWMNWSEKCHSPCEIYFTIFSRKPHTHVCLTRLCARGADVRYTHVECIECGMWKIAIFSSLNSMQNILTVRNICMHVHVRVCRFGNCVSVSVVRLGFQLLVIWFFIKAKLMGNCLQALCHRFNWKTRFYPINKCNK